METIDTIGSVLSATIYAPDTACNLLRASLESWGVSDTFGKQAVAVTSVLVAHVINDAESSEVTIAFEYMRHFDNFDGLRKLVRIQVSSGSAWNDQLLKLLEEPTTGCGLSEDGHVLWAEFGGEKRMSGPPR